MDLSERIKRMPKDVKITVIAIFSILIIATIVISVVFVTSRYNASSMRVIKVEGAVSVEDSNGNVKSVSKNTKFQSGDSLETGSNGIATVGLDSDKNVTMEPNSRADFVKMNNQLSMKLIRGGVFFEVTETLKQDESFEIKTSSMTAGIKGASGYIYYDINSRDNIVVTDGVVIVSATNPSSGETKYAEVHGGQSVSVRLYGDRKTDTVVFDVKDITKEELPLIAVEAIAADGALLSRVSQSTGWDKEELSTYVNAVMTGAVSIQTEATKSSEAVEVQTPDPETDSTETTETITEETTETSAAATATPTPEPKATNTPKPKATNTPKPAATSTPKPTATSTPTPVPTATATPSPSPVPTETEPSTQSEPSGESGNNGSESQPSSDSGNGNGSENSGNEGSDGTNG